MAPGSAAGGGKMLTTAAAVALDWAEVERAEEVDVPGKRRRGFDETSRPIFDRESLGDDDGDDSDAVEVEPDEPDVPYVLLVEDNSADADILCEIITRTPGMTDVRIKVVTTVGAAFKALKQRAMAQCVVCDHNLPGGGSLNVLDMTRARDPFTPFIVVTGGDHPEATDLIKTDMITWHFNKNDVGRLGIMVKRSIRDARRYRDLLERRGEKNVAGRLLPAIAARLTTMETKIDAVLAPKVAVGKWGVLSRIAERKPQALLWAIVVLVSIVAALAAIVLVSGHSLPFMLPTPSKP